MIEQRHRAKPFGRFTVLCLAVFWCLTSPAATRVALVSAGNRPEIQNVQDAALALLSKDASLEMVERTEIDRVLKEQSLSLGGADDAIAAIQTGRLLRADLFAVLENSVPFSSSSSQPLALVVFDARTGVRYADAVLSSSNAIPSASALANALRAAVAKSRQPAAQLHTVCLLLVRNADMPAQYDRLCDSTGFLLERELTALPNVVVLERSRLAHVHQEQQITGADNQLLSSLQMLELDVSREGDGLRGRLRAVSADDTSTNSIAATVPARDAAALAGALAQKTEGLFSAPATAFKPLDRVAEAAKFYREMKTLQEQQEYLGALRAMEAAYALAPEQPDYALDLLVCLCDGSTEYFAPGTERVNPLMVRNPPGYTVDMPTALAYGNRAADHFIDICRQVAATNRPGDPVPNYMQYLTGRVQWRGLLGNLASHANLMDESARAGMLALIHKDYVLVADVQEPFWRNRATNSATLAAYRGQFTYWFLSSGFEQMNPQETQNLRQLLNQRLEETTRRLTPPDVVNIDPSLNNLDGSPPSIGRLQALTQDSSPFMRLKAKIALVAAKNPGPITEEKVAAFHELRLQIQDEFEHGFAKDPGPLRDVAWGYLESAILNNIGNGPNGAGRECAEVCRFELARNRISLGFLRQTILAQAGALHDSERLELTDQVLDALKNKVDSQTVLLNSLGLGAPRLTNSADANWQRERERAIADFQRLHDTFADKVVQQGGKVPASTTIQTFPVNRPGVATWKSSTRLLDYYRPANGFHWLLRPVLQDRNVYEVALGLKDLGCPEDTLQLLKIPLDGGAIVDLSAAGPADLSGLLDLGNPSTRNQMIAYLKDPDAAMRFSGVGNLSAISNSVNRWMPLNTGPACLGGGNYYLALANHGLLIFPLKGGPVEHLSTSNGLPADGILALAFMDDKLYICTSVPTPVQRPFHDVGYIVSFAPKTRKLETLASSRRSEHLSPFDDQPDFLPFVIQADAGRHRLIVGVNASSGSNDVSGFWNFAPASNHFERLAVLDLNQPPTFTHTEWLARLDANTVGMMHQSNLNQANGFNQPANLTSFVFSVPGEGSSRTVWRTSVRTGRTPLVAASPVLLFKGWLWSGGLIQRISYETDHVETFAPLRAEYQFRASQLLQPIEDGRHLLAGDEFSLWIVEPSDPPQVTSQNAGNSPPKSSP